jgi:pimeloyl-ACP methyl ester carboxylesterase
VLGSGDIDLVLVMGWLTNLETYWEELNYRRFMQRLVGFTRLILFDKRGMGLSDRTTIGTLEERMDDARAVMDVVGFERAVLMGISEGRRCHFCLRRATPSAPQRSSSAAVR